MSKFRPNCVRKEANLRTTARAGGKNRACVADEPAYLTAGDADEARYLRRVKPLLVAEEHEEHTRLGDVFAVGLGEYGFRG